MIKLFLKKIFPIFSVVLLYGCASSGSINVSTWKKNYNPSVHARIRIIAKEKDLKNEYVDNSYHTYKYRVMVKENGKRKYYGFKPSFSSLIIRKPNATNILLGMPDTKTSRYCLSNKKCYIREFVVTAGNPVYLGKGTKKWCDGSWIFPKCYSLVYDDILIPKAGHDYEIINQYHVYQINNDGNERKIETLTNSR